MFYVRGFLVTLQFFTAIPISKELPMDKNHLEKAVRTLPLCGLLIGVLQYVLLDFLLYFSPFSIVAITFMLWLVTIVLTGGLHLDGWMDSSDAFFSYRDIDQRLAIMKDPRTGTFGVLSVIVLLAAKFFFMYEVVFMSSPVHLYGIILIPFMSRTIAGRLLKSVTPAKKDGLAFLFHQAIDGQKLYVYAIYTILLSSVFWWVTSSTALIVAFLVVSLLLYFYIRRKSVKWFGGMTGDVLGGAIEGVEVLLWMTLWLLHYFVMG